MKKIKKRTTSDGIWRYMSVAELISILDRRHLIFRQFRSLRGDDRAEGAIPKDLYERDRVLKGDSEARLKGTRASIDLKYCTYVQCWHRATREHSAFWKIYGNRGVAVRTNIRGVKEQEFWKENSLKGADIIYADSWTEVEKQGFSVPEGIPPNRTLMRRKRRAFSWEKEWRIFYSPPASVVGVVNASLPLDDYVIARKQWRATLPEHQVIQIDSVKWIEGVIVAPGAPSWVVDAISSVTARHNLPCRGSDI